MEDGSAIGTSGQSAARAALLSARQRRVLDAVQLRRPDRVPLFLPFGNLVADLHGASRQALYDDSDLSQTALEQAALRFQPDICTGMIHTPGPSRVLGDRMTRWPGHGLGPNASFQYHEGEYMKAEDYDAFLADPSDWAVRKYLPRVFSELCGLALLPPLAIASRGYYAVASYGSVLTLPPVTAALQALAAAAQLQTEWVGQQIASVGKMAALGFPSCEFFMGPDVSAPFDYMADTLRGMQGIFLDMRRRPDKLLAAEEKVIPFQVEVAIAACHARHVPYAFVPLHRGSDGFISLPQFERFYWPQLKELLLKLIAADVTPFVLWEGTWDDRLQYLAELPAGKTVGLFQKSDLFKAKDILGDTMCIVGGMPVSMLMAGTPQQVREHARRLCDRVGAGGGFIMSTDIGEMEGCSPDLIQTWVDATCEFGS